MEWDSFRSVGGGTDPHLTLQEAFAWENAVSSNRRAQHEDHLAVIRNLKRKNQQGNGAPAQHAAVATAVYSAPTADLPEKIVQLPLPPEPLAEKQYDVTTNVMTAAILSQLSDRNVRHTGDVDVRRRGLTPGLAKTMSEKMVEDGLSVRSLDVSGNRIKMEGFVHVCAGLLHMPGLQSLKVRDCGMVFARSTSDKAAVNRMNREDSEAVERLLSSTTTLGDLDLSQNKMEATGMGVLVRSNPTDKSALSKSLHTLMLEDTGIRDAAACSSLARFLGNMCSLNKLSLASNAIRGNEAALVAKGLCDCKALVDVDISNNGFGDAIAASALAPLLSPGSNIRMLNLSFNRFTGSIAHDQPDLLGLQKTVEQLGDIIPFLTRHAVAGTLSEEMEATKVEVDAVRAAVQAAIEKGDVKGTIVNLLGHITPEEFLQLEWLNLEGNTISVVAQGVAAHLLCHQPFEKQYRVDICEERTLHRFISKDEEIQESYTLVTCPHGDERHFFPKTALQVGGLTVWEVREDQRSIIAEVGDEEIELHGENPTCVSVLQLVEIQASNIPQPAPLAGLAKLGSHVLAKEPRFAPADQNSMISNLYREVGGARGRLERGGMSKQVPPKLGGQATFGKTNEGLMRLLKESRAERDAQKKAIQAVLQGSKSVGEGEMAEAGEDGAELGVGEQGKEEQQQSETKLLRDVSGKLVSRDRGGGGGGGGGVRKLPGNLVKASGVGAPSVIAKLRSGESHRNLLDAVNEQSGLGSGNSSTKSFTRRSSGVSNTTRSLVQGSRRNLLTSDMTALEQNRVTTGHRGLEEVDPNEVSLSRKGSAVGSPSRRGSTLGVGSFRQSRRGSSESVDKPISEEEGQSSGEVPGGLNRKGSLATDAGGAPSRRQSSSSGIGGGGGLDHIDVEGQSALQAAMKRRVTDKKLGKLWRRGKDRLFLTQGSKVLTHPKFEADPNGRDEHYVANPQLPTYACPERIEVSSGARGEHHGVLIKVTQQGAYEKQPVFTHMKLPPVKARLQSLQYTRNTVGLANLAALERNDEMFWKAIGTIKSESVSERDSAVRAAIACPEVVVIGEPFWFTYRYTGEERRLPGSHESDWIGLYRIKEGEKGARNEDNNTLVGRFRPPDGTSAEVQLRHIVWQPGEYQVRMFLVNSDTCIAKGNVFTVKYASATLECPDEIVVEESALEVRYTLDYRVLLHPKTDWLGIFPKGERFLTPHHAVHTVQVPPKNLGTISIDPHGFEGAYQIVYFQQYEDRNVIIGHCETTFTPKPPQAPQKFVKSSKPPSELRFVKFYVAGSYQDMAEEHALLLSKVIPKLKPICDARSMSVIFMDIRFGMTQDAESVMANVAHDPTATTIVERCLTELDSCLPYFICLVGHVYGNVPSKLPWRVSQLYPWLADNRYQNPRVSHGARLSLTEMEVINAVLVDPSLAPHARFYFRDPSFAVGRGTEFQDTDEWSKIALNVLKAKIRKVVEASEKGKPPGSKCMRIKPYFHPRHFSKLVIRDICDILDMDYKPGQEPSDLSLFWMTLDECATRHMKKTNVQIARELRALDAFCGEVDDHFNIAMDAGVARPLLVFGERGCGLTAMTVRWTQRRVTGKALLKDEGDVLDKTRSYSRFTDNLGRDSLMIAFYCGYHQRLRKPMDVLRVLMQTICDALSARFVDDDLLDEHIQGVLLARFQEAGARGISVYIVLDGLDHLREGCDTIDIWLPKTMKECPHVHWMVTASHKSVSKALVGVRQWWNLNLSTENWDEGFREGLLQSVIKRHKPAVYREHVERLKHAPLAAFPEYLDCAMDILRMCREDGPANSLTTWCEGFTDMGAMYVAVLKRWCSDVVGAQQVLSLLALSETGMYEHELMQLLDVPNTISCSHWQDLVFTLEGCTFVCCGLRQMINRNMAQVFVDKIMPKEQRRAELQMMERFFGSMPTCNRKLSEYPFVLEKLNDLEGMYAYITNIQIFFLMYSDPLRKQQFLQYIASLGKSPQEVQHTLRLNFEDYFKLTRRWFSDAFTHTYGGPVMYYELNPMIYRSDKDLLYFDDAVFYMSGYFELYGQHLDCIRDLEASLKALYGTHDIFSIPRINAEGCRFPSRVSRILRRLCHLYALHLEALLFHWLALDKEGQPKHEVPSNMEMIDTSWWTTLVPEGQARTLPSKLKLVYVLAKALSSNPATCNQDVIEVVDDEARNGHLSQYAWNSGAKCFVITQDTVNVRYGSCARDPVTLQSKPATVDHPLPGKRKRRVKRKGVAGESSVETWETVKTGDEGGVTREVSLQSLDTAGSWGGGGGVSHEMSLETNWSTDGAVTREVSLESVGGGAGVDGKDAVFVAER